MLGFNASLEVFFALDMRCAKLPSAVTPDRGFAIMSFCKQKREREANAILD